MIILKNINKQKYYYLLFSIGHYICPPNLISFYDFVLLRTLRYNNIFETITYNEFNMGHLNYNSFGLGISRSTFFRKAKKLKNLGILIKNKNTYALNIPKLLGLVSNLSKIYPDFIESINYFNDQFFNARIKLPAIVCKKESLVKLRNAAQKGIELNKKARSKQREKLRGLRSYSVNIVFALIKDFCSEYEISWGDRQTKKLCGQIKNWIRDCELRGVDVQETLRRLCNKWCILRSDIKSNSGERLYVSHNFSFSDYYKYQNIIDIWLEDHPCDTDGSPLEVTYL